MDAPAVDVSVSQEAGSQVVRLTGCLDASTAPPVRRALAACDDREPLRIDLAGIEFMDSSGIGLLIAERRRWEVAGTSFLLVEVRPSVARVLSLTGVDELLMGQRPFTAGTT
ncbi:MAG: anti-sigma-factor antagonist [Acidimicrobiales bacterium]|nr:anti-sigma-factor antagonist [Acidimicrobiales bacterium]